VKERAIVGYFKTLPQNLYTKVKGKGIVVPVLNSASRHGGV